ncbi:hypothetical protein AK812_SmicGene44210 [Symbiodinium microadriaticum]|uniref:Uncharacterized protein n=1 Tax=Symbiodinium microadriaticum TaxID=2951 RepID=A0A1Q9BZ30_SYMMI|nr:hypothetical protein AK812_SmicGene44210 [Symbiodinium microadriaticum]
MVPVTHRRRVKALVALNACTIPCNFVFGKSPERDRAQRSSQKAFAATAGAASAAGAAAGAAASNVTPFLAGRAARAGIASAGALAFSVLRRDRDWRRSLASSSSARKTGGDANEGLEGDGLDLRFQKTRLVTFAGMVLGYAVYYFTRLSFTYVGLAMRKDLGLSMVQLGTISSLFPLAVLAKYCKTAVLHPTVAISLNVLPRCPIPEQADVPPGEAQPRAGAVHNCKDRKLYVAVFGKELSEHKGKLKMEKNLPKKTLAEKENQWLMSARLRLRCEERRLFTDASGADEKAGDWAMMLLEKALSGQVDLKSWGSMEERAQGQHNANPDQGECRDFDGVHQKRAQWRKAKQHIFDSKVGEMHARRHAPVKEAEQFEHFEPSDNE